MNAKSDNLERSYSKQLTEFAEQLQVQIADEDLLDDIHEAIHDLLMENPDVEPDIRRILIQQHKVGNLRDETFELVKKMLDRMVSENIETAPEEPVAPAAPAPAAPAPQQQTQDPFRDTTVIEDFKLNEESTEDRLQVGSVLRDRFLLQERVAGGSMGVVYKALDRRLAETSGSSPLVAIKILTPELSKNGNALRALQQEAAKGRCLSHPNIVRFIDLDREDELYFIVMEWLDGRCLANILDDSNSKNIDKETTMDIVRQVAKALDYAHRRGVVHADVKPGNIMVSPNGEVKLFDFGVARVRQKQTDGRADFDPGVLGAMTPAYSSMQVLTGEEPVASDDVFSLACLMYRLIAGYRVFGPRNAAEASEAGMEPQRPQGLSDSEWRALRKALSYSRVSRFASPKEFVAALDAQAPLSATQPLAQITEPQSERHSMVPALFATFVVVAGFYALYQAGILEQLPSISGTVATTGESPAVRPVPPAPVDSESSTDPQVPDLPEEETPVEGVMAENQEALPADDSLLVDTTGDVLVEEEPVALEALVDFSTLPPPTVEIPLAFPGTVRTELDLTLMEDEDPAIVDLVRDGDLTDELFVKLEEISYSGNRSPWESGQFRISDDSTARFPPGQARARVIVSMSPDPLREPDREVSLLVRNRDDAESEYALINLNLLDDDQRRFESSLGPNTIAFAVGQVSVREHDPAVQIDVVRFNPDQTTVTFEYILREVTATEGEDYFAPGSQTVRFGPGQRSARILIPLIQDSKPESDEAFLLEMAHMGTDPVNANIFRRIAVMIRDDD